LPEAPEGGPPGAGSAVDDLVFDVIAGAVVHRALVSGRPVDTEWVRRFTALLLGGLGAAGD
ncbi:TetR family transcriptional regulator, partial [Streptomyces fradiae]